ncbi:MAG: hypothetical protein M0Q51_07195 [Bacteroidales bacterium]|nr:hypothetical protein [Bacteroidales bacterium]
MKNITSIAELKNAIQLLEAEQAIKGQQLKEQFYLTYESYKPVKLLNSTLKDIASSPYLIENIVGATVGLATGYLSRKIIVGASGGIFRKILGSVLQFGVTNLVAQHPDAIMSIGQFAFKHIFRKKEMNSKKL